MKSTTQKNAAFARKFKRRLLSGILLSAVCVSAMSDRAPATRAQSSPAPAGTAPPRGAAATADDPKIQITADFEGREIAAAGERIELRLSRELKAEEGRLAVFVGDTDLTALFSAEPQSLAYTPIIEPLPAGENKLTVYRVSPDGGDWRPLAEFSLKVRSVAESRRAAENQAEASAPGPKDETNGAQPAAAAAEKEDRWEIEFTPNLSLNTKGQNQTLTFPREGEPERNPSTDLDGQGNVFFKVSRGGWSLANKFDFVGVSFQNNALRFGELGERAPQIDLSSYLVEFGKGRFSVKLGHISFGSNRHLINSFSSRGITVTVPVGKQNEISFAAMNGTSVVGFDNFFGVARRRHSVVSTTFAREFIRERPQGLRLEFTVMRGSLLPLSNFNQREVNDAEKSLGFGFRAIGNTFGQRLRYEVGLTRSRFTNPGDPSLEQGFAVTEIRPATRYARYGEVSFDFVRDLKLWREKALKITGTYRHEEIEPLYRSIVASTQADRRQNQFEVSAAFGEMNFTYGNLRDRDNLNDIPSILKTLNRRNNLVFGVALNSFFTPSKPVRWLPQVSYTLDRTHQFGAFLPVDGDFRDPSQVPDQQNVARSLNAQWQLSPKLNLGLRHNRAFQDNRQPGRELADFKSSATGVTVGLPLSAALNLNFDLSRESLTNLEQPRTDRTLRLGSNVAWQTPFLKNSTLSANFSTTLAGDTRNFNDTRNIDFDVQWAYKFGLGKEKFKKLEAQFFVRYANRYGDAIDRVFFFNNFNKTQSFNAGLTFNIF